MAHRKCQNIPWKMTEKSVFFQHSVFSCQRMIFRPFLHPHDGPPGLSLVIPGLFWTFLTTFSWPSHQTIDGLGLLYRPDIFYSLFLVKFGWRGKNAFFVMMAVEPDETPPKICTRGGRDGAESAFKLTHVTLIDFSPRSNQPKWWNIFPKHHPKIFSLSK